MKAQSDGHELKTVTLVDGMADRPNGELKFVTDMRKVCNHKEHLTWLVPVPYHLCPPSRATILGRYQDRATRGEYITYV